MINVVRSKLFQCNFQFPDAIARVNIYHFLKLLEDSPVLLSRLLTKIVVL
jgi:hypothetical protein